MSEIEKIGFREVTRPLRTTFSTSLGRKDVMRSVIVRVLLRDGSWGLGECPTSFAVKEETIPAIKGIIREAAAVLKYVPIDDYAAQALALRKVYPLNPMTVSGLEVAMFRAHLGSKGTSEYGYFGGRSRTLETDITIPYTTNPGALEKWIDYAFKRKFTIYKLKVSGNIATDKKLVSKVCLLLGDHVDSYTLRLDGNQGFTEKTFLALTDFLARNNLRVELFEQPLPKKDYKGLREIKKRSFVPIILDETVFTLQDLERVLENDSCHGINIKIAKSGISESMALYKQAKAGGLKLMIGCMTETMTGLSAGINFAAGTDGFDYIDLDAIHFLHHPTSYGTIDIRGAQYVLR